MSFGQHWKIPVNSFRSMIIACPLLMENIKCRILMARVNQINFLQKQVFRRHFFSLLFIGKILFTSEWDQKEVRMVSLLLLFLLVIQKWEVSLQKILENVHSVFLKEEKK